MHALAVATLTRPSFPVRVSAHVGDVRRLESQSAGASVSTETSSNEAVVQVVTRPAGPV